MTPSIEERREAAANLKSLTVVVPRGDNDAAGFIEALDDVLFDFGPNELGDIANRLADLIEPSPERTCRNIGGDKWEFMCSECGGHTHGSPFHIPDAERDELARALGGHIASLHGSVPRFCPNCGARVAEP